MRPLRLLLASLPFVPLLACSSSGAVGPLGSGGSGAQGSSSSSSSSASGAGTGGAGTGTGGAEPGVDAGPIGGDRPVEIHVPQSYVPGTRRAAGADAPRLRRERGPRGGLPPDHAHLREARVHLRPRQRHGRQDRRAVLERDGRVLQPLRLDRGRLELPQLGHHGDRGAVHHRSQARVPRRPLQRRLHVVPHGVRPRGPGHGHRQPRRRDVGGPVQVQAERARERPRDPRHGRHRHRLRRRR